MSLTNLQVTNLYLFTKADVARSLQTIKRCPTYKCQVGAENGLFKQTHSYRDQTFYGVKIFDTSD